MKAIIKLAPGFGLRVSFHPSRYRHRRPHCIDGCYRGPVGFRTSGFGFCVRLCLAAALLFCPALAKAAGSVTMWGSGQTNPAPSLSSVATISANVDHELAVRSDGTVVAWGYNMDGQCDVPPGLANVVNVAAGAFFSLALKNNAPSSAGATTNSARWTFRRA